MIRIRRITTTDPLYEQECDLREDVLLRPIGYDIERFRREFKVEDRFEHFVAIFDHSTAGERVIGCALLLPNYPGPGEGKLMQMAVDRQRQGEGIGRLLVTSVESRAFGELGLGELFCHAQLRAVGFYQRLGWEIESGEFMEAGIPHLRMVMRPGPASEGGP